MSTDPAAAGSGAGPSRGGEPGAGGPDAQPSEAELRAAYEAELARITSTDLMLQAAVSLLNVGSYRLMPPQTAGADPAATAAAGAAGAGGDLEQVRDAIDGVRALLEILERRVPSELRPLRDALSQLQMAYAREVQAQGGGSGEPGAGGAEGPGDSGGGGGGSGTGGPGTEQPPSQPPSPGPGPAESSGRLWVPGR